MPSWLRSFKYNEYVSPNKTGRNNEKDLLSLNRSLDIFSSLLTLEKTSKLVKCSLNRSLCRHSR